MKFVEIQLNIHNNNHSSADLRKSGNPAETQIREVKKKLYSIKSKTNTPDRVWNFVISWTCKTGNLTANIYIYEQARTLSVIIIGETPDISEYFYFVFV